MQEDFTPPKLQLLWDAFYIETHVFLGSMNVSYESLVTIESCRATLGFGERFSSSANGWWNFEISQEGSAMHRNQIGGLLDVQPLQVRCFVMKIQ